MFYKLGNTVFEATSVIGMQVSRSNGSKTHPYKITIYLNNDALKSISYPLTSKDQADQLCKILTRNTIVDCLPQSE